MSGQELQGVASYQCDDLFLLRGVSLLESLEVRQKAQTLSHQQFIEARVPLGSNSSV